MTDRLVDAREAAEFLGVPVSWVRDQTRRAEKAGHGLPFVPLGRYRRYDLDDLRGYVETLKRGSSRHPSVR